MTTVIDLAYHSGYGRQSLVGADRLLNLSGEWSDDPTLRELEVFAQNIGHELEPEDIDAMADAFELGALHAYNGLPADPSQ